MLVNPFDSRKLDTVLYILEDFGSRPPKKNALCISRDGIDLLTEKFPDPKLDQYISAADVVVMPYRICYTSGAVHRALQLGKMLVVSKPVGRTLPPCGRIIQYEHEKDILVALMKARLADTTPLPPRMVLNVQQPGYCARVQAFYRNTRP